MIGTSVNLQKAVEGQEIVAAIRVQLALPSAAAAYDDATLVLSGLTIDASTTSDMPEDTRLQVGYPAMQATFELSGLVDQSDETKTAPWLFGRYSTTSPLYRSDVLYVSVTVDVGIYTDQYAGTPSQGAIEWVRKFTGYVDTVNEVTEDGSVQFTCIESMRQLLRADATLPPLFNVEVSAEYLIDALLRADTAGAVSSWPQPVSEPLLSVGFRAAPLAETGDLFTDYGSTYAPGVFGSALSGASTLKFAPFSGSGAPNTGPYVAANYYLHTPYVLGGSPYGSPSVPTSSNLFLEFWVNGDVSTVFPQVLIGRAPSGNLGNSWSANWFRLSVKSTGLVVESSLFATQTWSTTISAGAHYVSLWMQSDSIGSTLDITVTLDGTQHVFTRLAVNIGGTARNYLAVGWSANTGVASTVEALQVSTNTLSHSAIFLGAYPFTPRAVLDPSLNSTLRVVNQVSGDTYSVIQQLTDAELGVAGGDETGTFRSYNRDTLRSATSVRDVTSAASLVSVGGIQTAAASVKNHCTVDWTGWDLADTATIIYQATAPIRVPAGKAVVLTPTLAAPAVLYGNVASGGLQVVADGSLTNPGFGLRASTSKGGATEFTGYLRATLRQPATDRLEITLTNGSTADAWLVSPENYLDLSPPGAPVLQIWGYVWSQTSGTVDVQYPFAADGGAAKSRFGDQPHPISGNPWIQDPGTAFELATDIVSDLCIPRPDLTGVEIVPDPRLQLTDVIRLRDPDWTGVDEYARIFGWKLSWSPTDYSMTLDARTLAPPGGWIMGVAGRSEIDSTAYAYPST